MIAELRHNHAVEKVRKKKTFVNTDDERERKKVEGRISRQRRKAAVKAGWKVHTVPPETGRKVVRSGCIEAGARGGDKILLSRKVAGAHNSYTLLPKRVIRLAIN